MAKIKIIELSEEQRAALERGFTHGPSRAFRQRCQVILLKAGSPQAQRLTSKQVAAEVRCCEVVVNTWLKRHEVQGFQGLRTRQGQGRAPILQTETDLAAVRRAVEQNRQHISLAKAELTKAERVKELGKEFSTLTLKRFLKKRRTLQAHSTTSKSQCRHLCLQAGVPDGNGTAVRAGPHRFVLR